MTGGKQWHFKEKVRQRLGLLIIPASKKLRRNNHEFQASLGNKQNPGQPPKYDKTEERRKRRKERGRGKEEEEGRGGRGNVSHLVACLPSTYKALNLVPSTA